MFDFPKISVVCPTVRGFECLSMLEESLRKQTFQDYEFIICSPKEIKEIKLPHKWIPDPPKNEGDLYGYHKAINELIKVSEGDVVVCVNDMTALHPDNLEKFVKHYEEHPMGIYCGLANPDVKEEAKGYGDKWLDVRWNYISSPIQPTGLTNFDTALSGLPLKALKEIGYPYIDPVYDQYACWGDRELLNKLVRMGYQLYIDSTIVFDGFSHLGHPEFKDWQERFERGKLFFDSRNPDAIM